MLVSTGLGALLSRRFATAPTDDAGLLGALAVLTVFYEFAHSPHHHAARCCRPGSRVRVLFTVAILTPLGLCLGMFMPLGLTGSVRSPNHGEEYVAWAWAVNGFFSVIGSVLTTILSMTLRLPRRAVRRPRRVRDRRVHVHAAPECGPHGDVGCRAGERDDADRGEERERRLGRGAEAGLPVGGG